jgi:hypothetical protein
MGKRQTVETGVIAVQQRARPNLFMANTRQPNRRDMFPRRHTLLEAATRLNAAFGLSDRIQAASGDYVIRG